MSKVDSFWSHEAQNIRCVRESDYDSEKKRYSELLAAYHEVCAEESKARAELAALKSGHGEAVEVVCVTQGDCNVTWTATKELTPAGTPLMSVHQHHRIMAAITAPPASADAVSVPRDIALRMAADAAQYDHEHAVVNDNVQLWQQPNARVSLTVGDLRTVRALLAQQEVKS